MAKSKATVRVVKEVVVCDRCKKPKSEDAKPLKIEYSGTIKTPTEYNVCDPCSQVILGSIIKVDRKPSKRKPSPAQPASQPTTEI